MWEISIKQGWGKLDLPGIASEWLPRALDETGIDVLDIAYEQLSGPTRRSALARPPRRRPEVPVAHR